MRKRIIRLKKKEMKGKIVIKRLGKSEKKKKEDEKSEGRKE